ncbi:hypothetical protein OOK31_21350 [Streptomyces sp. NBC_00249]|uniref:hypothetical protein n=1 Tax=Streptomyces sp. NBC_00249 TaxID=2975690 RepID=UPI00224D8FBE|nr:hypothetical protein [Streptomyces sp. NBC_00249]MCX5196412.1 hypothetical protein [Streptomyces sp. NBC_00249]
MEDNPYAVEPASGPMPPAAPAHAPWTAFDDHLVHTCRVVHDLMHGRLSARVPLPSTARLAPGELSLAVGPAARLTWRGLGDGSYSHSNVMAFGRPAFVLGSLAGNALGNAARKSRAAADAQPRWVYDGNGELTVTNRRAYLGQPNGFLDLNWTGLDTIDLAGPDVFQCSFQNTHTGGYSTVRVQSMWASLMFALAAHVAFPAHPRLLSGGWLPPGFEARCAVFGVPCPPVR